MFDPLGPLPETLSPPPGRGSAAVATGPNTGELALSLGVVALGAFFLVDSFAIRVTALYAKIGPRFFPLLVGGTLVVLGLALGWRAWRGGWREPADLAARGATDWLAVVLLSIGVLQQIAFMRQLGFIISSTLLFVFVALAFGSRRYLLNALIGAQLSFDVYVAFTQGLDLDLPRGSFWGLF